jgi:hypothetical protein
VFQGVSYAWTRLAGNFPEVERDAIQMGGHLVDITSAEENAWLVRTFGDGPYWIGLVQTPGAPEPSDGWHWVTGQPISFANWTSNQPDNHSGQDNYGFLVQDSKGMWGDVPIEGWPQTSNFRGVVKFSPGAAMARSAVAPAPDAPGTFQGHRYLWTRRSGNFREVARDAREMGGHLVQIDSAEENAWLVRNFGDGPYWIGLQQTRGAREPAGGWHWVGGAPIAFSNWASSQPDNHSGHDDYGFFVQDWKGLWGDVPIEGWPPTSNYKGIVELP